MRTAVLNVVGLTESVIGPATPRIAAFRRAGAGGVIAPAFPAVTCTAQATYLTGRPPAEHGIVGNGWYDRTLAEVHFWKQSNRVVQGRKLWEELRAAVPGFTCAQLFWWFNLYAGVDYAITPRPIYPADGRKIFDIQTWPLSMGDAVKADLGEFPFATFWGPAAGRVSPQGSPSAATEWIARSARWVEERFQPTLNLVYLPHLDYNLQRLGPEHPDIAADFARIDTIVGELVDFFEARAVQVVVLSEYGIEPVRTPIHLNRLFREQGWLAIKDELGLERLDCGNCRVFAVADHQIAHVYVNDPALLSAARALLEQQPGIERVLDAEAQAAAGLQHERAGDLVAVAREVAWFTYYYWLDDHVAPDFARTVDIHRKPGYDPAELFLDPALRWPRARIATRLLQKKLGLRMLMDVVPLDATLVRGSHGRPVTERARQPVLLTRRADLLPRAMLRATDVCAVLRDHVLAK